MCTKDYNKAKNSPSVTRGVLSMLGEGKFTNSIAVGTEKKTGLWPSELETPTTIVIFPPSWLCTNTAMLSALRKSP